MSQFLSEMNFYDQAGRLDEEEKKQPLRVLERYFGDYRLEESRCLLWSMVEVCMTTDNSFFGESEDRADLLTQVKGMMHLLEASNLLVKKGPGKE